MESEHERQMLVHPVGLIDVKSCEATNARPPSSQLQLLSRVVVIIGLGLVAYEGSLLGAFVLDDSMNIIDNSVVRQLWPNPLKLSPNRPLVQWTFSLNFSWDQLNPYGYHVFNLAVHLVNAILVYQLFFQTLRLPRFANHFQESHAANWSAIVAILWVIHPLGTQAVTYISQRFESMASMFMLLTLMVSIRAIIQRKNVDVVLAAVFSWCGLLSKETAVSLPMIFFLYDYCFLTRTAKTLRDNWRLYLALASPWVWFIPVTIRHAFAENSAVGFNLVSVTPGEYLGTQPEILLRYLQLSIWPAPLCFDYAWAPAQHPSWSTLCCLVVVILFSACCYAAFRQRVVGFLGMTFFLILAPSSSFLPIADLAAEHRMYLPLVLLIMGCVLVIRWLWSRMTSSSMQLSTLQMISCLLLFLTVFHWLNLTRSRNLEYQDPLKLWQSVVRVRPENARAWLFVAQQLFSRDRQDEALVAIYRGLQSPRMSTTVASKLYASAAQILIQKRDLDRAYRCIDEALRIAPDSVEIVYVKAQILSEDARWDEAVLLMKPWISNARFPEFNHDYASLLSKTDRVAEAIDLWSEIVQDWPDFLPARKRLAWILATHPEEQWRDVERAFDLIQPLISQHVLGDSEASIAVAAVLAEKGQFDEARKVCQEALQRANPQSKKSIRERLEIALRQIEERKPIRDQ